MAGPSTNGKNQMLDAVRGSITHVSLHTADPGDAGSSEVSGGSPAYARKTISSSASSGGVVTFSALPTFDVPAGITVTHLGFWTAVTGGTIKWSEELKNSGGTPSPQTFTTQGTLALASVTLNLNG